MKRLIAIFSFALVSNTPVFANENEILSEKKTNDPILKKETSNSKSEDNSKNDNKKEEDKKVDGFFWEDKEPLKMNINIDDVSNIALKKSHHETLRLADAALDANAVNIRDYTWLTLAFDLKKMKLAKELIRKFQDEFLELVDENSNPQEVYRLAIQLFPLTKNIKSGELQ